MHPPMRAGNRRMDLFSGSLGLGRSGGGGDFGRTLVHASQLVFPDGRREAVGGGEGGQVVGQAVDAEVDAEVDDDTTLNETFDIDRLDLRNHERLEKLGLLESGEGEEGGEGEGEGGRVGKAGGGDVLMGRLIDWLIDGQVHRWPDG